MEDFYDEELNTAVEQQAQRYRFFAERNDDLIKRFVEWTKHSIEFIENEYTFLYDLNQNKENDLPSGNIYNSQHNYIVHYFF